MHKSNRYFSEEEYFNGKFNFIHTYLHDNYCYALHSHQFYEINVIASGEGEHLIESTTLPAKTGDVFVIPPDTNHSYRSNERLDIYHVLIKNDFLSRYADELSTLDGFNILFEIEPQIRRSSGKNHNLSLDNHELSVIKENLKNMIYAENSEQFVYLNALTLAFICKLCKKISGAVQNLGKGGDIIGVMEFIKSNLDRKLSLDDLSKHSNMSKATLNRRFQDAVGTSPMDYLLSCRIIKAKELIDEGNLTKTEIANACGFFDASHMNKYL